MHERQPFVVIVILNWNNARDTVACLESVFRLDYPNYQVLVVDNGSTDNSVRILRARFPDVEVLETGANLGYAGGNNVGIRRALERGARYVFVLNNDVIVHNRCLTELVLAAEEESLIAFCGPMIYQRGEQGGNIIQSAGTITDRPGSWHQRGLGERDVGQFDQLTEADSLVGCALLARCSALRKIGLLDERFYLYDEDIDWCLRAREAGYRIRFVPSAKVWHRSSNARADELPRLTYYINRNRYLLMKLHGCPWRARLLTLGQHLIWLLNWSLNPKWRFKKRERDALARALMDAFRNRYGRYSLR